MDSLETATTPYDEETVTNYEVGLKSDWLDGSLRINVAAFLMDYEDKQEELQLPSATSGTGQVTLVTNASTAEMYGLELDVHWLPRAGLEPARQPRPARRPVRTTLSFWRRPASATSPTWTSAGRRTSPPRSAPPTSGPWARGRAWMVFGWRYLGKHEVDFANKPELTNAAQHLINASANVEVGAMRFSLFGRNLAKEDGYGIGFDVAGLWSYAATRPPRTYGLEVSYSFEGN